VDGVCIEGASCVGEAQLITKLIVARKGCGEQGVKNRALVG
jgi:hypothetical protein